MQIAACLAHLADHRKIVSARLLRAETMLRDSDMPQHDIAQQSGFPNPHAFHKAFRSKHGCTPAQFRTGAVTDKRSSDRSDGAPAP